jgi:hypothetical protein
MDPPARQRRTPIWTATTLRWICQRLGTSPARSGHRTTGNHCPRRSSSTSHDPVGSSGPRRRLGDQKARVARGTLEPVVLAPAAMLGADRGVRADAGNARDRGSTSAAIPTGVRPLRAAKSISRSPWNVGSGADSRADAGHLQPEEKNKRVDLTGVALLFTFSSSTGGGGAEQPQARGTGRQESIKFSFCPWP